MRSPTVHVSGPLLALLAALALLPATLFAATEIHVATGGHDANPGTVSQPVATPQGAQIRVRALIQAGLSSAVEVVFAAGTYALDAPLELRPEDSGTAAFPITWKAATNGTVVLSGGKRITGTWTNGGNGIWFTDLTGVGLGTNQWNFRQLFVNGTRMTRARYPNVTQANPFLYATAGSTNYVIINPALVKSSWGTAVDAQINIVPQSRFFNQWNTVTGVNTNTGRIDIADSERHRLIDSGSWFWIEGVQAELDQPGEWFLNPTTGRLYYMPTSGINPNSLDFVAPYLNRIVNVKGDVNAGTHVQHVNFDGLEFRDTDFTLGQIEARVHTDTAIMFENTTDSSVHNNWLYDMWGWKQQSNGTPVRTLANGVFLDWDTSNTTVKDNWIYNTGAEAVKVIFGGNWNVVNTGNQSSSTVITPPFVAEVGPGGTATHGIDLASRTLTGSVIHYTDSAHVATTGTWTPASQVGLSGLFVFNCLVGTAAVPSQAVYTLPITEDGTYQISLLYAPGTDRASNVPITITHADGTTNVTWNMQQGSQFGFAVAVGNYRFVAAQTNTITLSTTNANGKVIADSVGFVKIENNLAPVATNVEVAGSAYVGGTLTGRYYSDANNDLQGASRFQWYRSADGTLQPGDTAIAGATNSS